MRPDCDGTSFTVISKSADWASL